MIEGAESPRTIVPCNAGEPTNVERRSTDGGSGGPALLLVLLLVAALLLLPLVGVDG